MSNFEVAGCLPLSRKILKRDRNCYLYIFTRKFFKDYKLHSPYGLVQFFVVFEKFARAYLFQIAREKSFDYLLIIYK